MRHIYKKFALLDLALIIIILAISGAILPFIRAHAPETVVVYREEQLLASYPLDKNRRFSVNGAIGPVEIEVKDGAVRVASSTCPRQICRRTAPIRRAGSQIVCVPNRMVVVIKAVGSGEEHQVDGVAR